MLWKGKEGKLKEEISKDKKKNSRNFISLI